LGKRSGLKLRIVSLFISYKITISIDLIHWMVFDLSFLLRDSESDLLEEKLFLNKKKTP